MLHHCEVRGATEPEYVVYCVVLSQLFKVQRSTFNLYVEVVRFSGR